MVGHFFTLVLISASWLAPPVQARLSAETYREKACYKKALSLLWTQEVATADAVVGAPAPIRGVSVHQKFALKGLDYPVFQQLGDGSYGMAYLGFDPAGNWIVVKRLKSAAPELAYIREIKLTEFLSKRGVAVSRVIESSWADRTLIKTYVPGFYLGELTLLARQGRIRPELPKMAATALHELQSRLKRLQNSPSFKDWSARQGIPAFIDTDESNFLYQNGRWILIDP